MTAAALKAQNIINANLAATRQLSAGRLAEAAGFIVDKVRAGATIFLCGNGGSAAETQHLTTELLGRFMLERPGIPAISLVTDPGVLTSLANDYSYNEIFSRQVQTLLKPGDILLGLSTSGRSANILAALAAAKNRGGHTVFLAGPARPEEAAADVVITVPSSDTHRIQELHLLCAHILCQLIEDALFGAVGRPVGRS